MAGGLDAGNRILSSVESWSTRQGSSDTVADLLYRSRRRTVWLIAQSTEYRAVSDVFQNIDLPTPFPSECVLPLHQRRGVHTRRAVRGWGVNILEDARHWIGLLQYNPSTVNSIHRVSQCLSLRRNWVPPLPPPASECGSFPRTQVRGDPFACGGGGGDLIPTKGQKLWYSM